MKNILLRSLALIALGLLSPQAYGQQDTPSKKLISVINLTSNYSIEQVAWLKANKRPEESKDKLLTLSSSNILPPVSYTGPPHITLVDPKTPDAENETGYTPVASLKLPAANQVIIALLPSASKQESSKFRAMAIDASLSKFPLGSRHFYNFTPYKVRGIMGKTPFKPKSRSNKAFQISSRKNKLVTALDPNAPSRSGMQAYMEYYNNQSQQWELFKSSRWFHFPTKRKLIFIYHPARSSTPALKIFTQKVESSA